MKKKLIIFSSVVWNFYRGRHFEITDGLADKFEKIFFTQPLEYIDAEKTSIRFEDLSSNPVKNNVEIIKRNINLKKSFLIIIIENFQNTYYIWKYKPDIVLGFDLMNSILPALRCRIIGKNFVFDYMDDWELVDTGFQSFAIKRIFKPLGVFFSKNIIATSHRILEKVSKINKNSYFLPNAKPLKQIEEFNQKYGKSAFESNKIVFISSLRDWYDFDIFFGLAERLPDFEIEIYGNGDIFEQLNQKSKNYKNIKFLGNIAREKSYEKLSESFVGIIPLRLNDLNDSTLPIKLFDYMMLAKPLIVSATYELQKINDKNNCFLIYQDLENLAEMIIKLKSDKNLYDKYAQKSLEVIKKDFNYDILLEEYFNILEK